MPDYNAELTANNIRLEKLLQDVNALPDAKVEQGKTINIVANGSYSVTPDPGKTLSVVYMNVNVPSSTTEAIERSYKTVYNPDVSNFGPYAFAACHMLTSVNLPNAYIIMDSGFQDCIMLNQIYTPRAIEIRGYAFYLCSSLKEATFESVTKLWGGSIFRNCSALKKLDFLVLNNIEGRKIFADSPLETLIIRTNAVCTLSESSIFSNSPIESGTGYIYVPKALVDQYKVAPNWYTFANQFRAIEDYPDITGG